MPEKPIICPDGFLQPVHFSALRGEGALFLDRPAHKALLAAFLVDAFEWDWPLTDRTAAVRDAGRVLGISSASVYRLLNQVATWRWRVSERAFVPPLKEAGSRKPARGAVHHHINNMVAV